MRDAKINWRDYDWDIGGEGANESLAPLALDTPGRIIYYPVELFASTLSLAPGGEVELRRKRTAYLNWVHGMAMLCQQHHFVLWCNDPGDAVAYYEEADRAWDIQVAAAGIVDRAVEVGEAQLMPRARFGVGSGPRWAPSVAAQVATQLRAGASLAGRNRPRGQPLLRNVWVGWRVNVPAGEYQTGMIRNLCRVPAAVRFLWIPSGKVCDFESLVWTMEAAPVEFGDGDKVIDTAVSDARRLHWVVCGGINTEATKHHIAQATESGTPIFVEAARSIGGECAVQMFPVEAEREPLLLPEMLRAEWRAFNDERRR